MTYRRVCNKNNTTDARCGAGIAYPFIKIYIFKIMYLLLKLRNVWRYQRHTKQCPYDNDRATRTQEKTGCELMFSGRVSNSCSTSSIRRIILVTNPAICHKWGKDYTSLNWPDILSGCSSYHDFLDRELLLIRTLLYQGFLVAKLKSSPWLS
jgi:hypothetical protein